MGKQTSGMMQESVLLSIFSVSLQGMGLLFNIFLTRSLGAASVGALTLMGSFFGLACVLSGGSGFLAASRFLSEEIGAGGDPQHVFRYVTRFCLLISGTFASVCFLTARWTAPLISATGATAETIRLLSLSLPVCAAVSCLKGRCYAFHRVYVPAVAECVEFLLRSGSLAFCAVFFIPRGALSILSAFAISTIIGQGSAMLFLLAVRVPASANSGCCKLHFRQFLRLVLPMIGNACLVSLLSSTNDALVPLTLRQYGNSTEAALSQFGEFEAIIIPTLFFPSVVQCCMSGLLVPTLSKARAESDDTQIKRLTQHVLEQTVAFSLIVVLYLAQFGNQIGKLLGGAAFTGNVLRAMSPVIPFIYLEIILEGVLRGLGKQNFSSLNYFAEYTVRISVLLICVPLFGFYGIVASYMACNLTGNAVRLFFVMRLTGLRPSWKRILVRPGFALILSWQITNLIWLAVRHLQISALVQMILYGCFCGAGYWFLLRVCDQLELRSDIQQEHLLHRAAQNNAAAN